MVDSTHRQLERESNPDDAPRIGGRDGCVQDRLGSILSRRVHRRVLVKGREDASHKCPGADGSNFWSSGFLLEQTNSIGSVEDRQCLSHVLCQQDGRNEVLHLVTACKESMAVVHTQRDSLEGTTYPREAELHSRFHVASPERSIGLDPGWRDIRNDQRQIGSHGRGLIRNQILHPSAPFLQLATGSNGRGYGRIPSGLEHRSGICTSTLVPALPSLEQGAGSSCNISSGSTLLEDPSMVSSTCRDACGFSSFAAARAYNSRAVSELRLSGGKENSTTGRVQGIRMRLKTEGISDEAVDIIMASWRSKTDANYDSAWRKWQEWCSDKGVYPFAADLPSILSFLADQYREGRAYRSLNCYRSAISSAHLPAEGFAVGKHPLVCRLLKGVFNLRPPLPRYKHVWEVSQVTSFLDNLEENEQLSLKWLTWKLAMLLALVLAHRSSGLVRLSLQGIMFTPEGVRLSIKGLAKQTAPGRESSLQPVTIAAYRGSQKLCPVECLKAYRKRTKEYRKTPEHQQLFISHQAPHKPVASSTIARWIKQILEASGVSLGEFSVHSTRGAASTAAALSGLSTQQIMARAGWSSEDTFSRHYYKPSAEADNAMTFVQAVLNNSTNMQRTC